MRPLRLAALFTLLAACPFLSSGSPEPGHPEEKPVVLLTGFAPFGGRPRNASWDAVKPLHEKTVDGVKFHCVELPVEWGRVREPLEKAIAATRPRAVLCIGEGRLGTISVECVARNAVRDLPDNARRLPGRSVVIPEGPESYRTALPAAQIVEELTLRNEGFRIEKSEDAGRYLCEECFYILMHLGTRHLTAGEPHGFIHIPPHPLPQDEKGSQAHAAKVRAAVGTVVRLLVRQNPKLFPREPAEAAAR